ncbi:MAG: RiPP maturation radical SAM C-methyltransferase [Deltaproteobacteria bacterium]|nr:RiPP maturation radical SAM C-methyltransferase [Deltaproteobacteria bacterium]
MSASVLLIASPWRHPGEPALALGLLKGVLEREGLTARNLYASLLYPRTEVDSGFLDRYGCFLFAPWLAGGPSPEAAREAILDRYVEDVSMGGLRADQADTRRAIPTAMLDHEIARAGTCIDRISEVILDSGCPTIGFSVTFDSQLPATLAIIERIKARRPALRVVLGGAGCQEEQALGLVRSFPLIDAVCAGEGEFAIGPLCRALGGDGKLEDVTGIVYRDSNGVHRTPSAPLCRDLDVLPFTRYDDYFEQLDASEWRGTPAKLLFETSRGCWWGQKHLCSFCGLNGDGLAFRAKSPERAFDEIASLYRDYPRAHYLMATDNIIAMPYFEKLMPRLAELPREPGRPLQIFYEIKSNLQPEQVEVLARAGIRTVQPGIESFSDEVLELMDKGCTGLGQVQFVKWAMQAGIMTNYSILVRNPGETASAYREMIALIRQLFHLPPPNAVVLVQLERFSPYFRNPERYGLQNIRPHRFYDTIFPDRLGGTVDLERLVYHFEYDHPIKQDTELLDSYRELCATVDAWRATFKEGMAYYLDRGPELVVIDHRDGERVHLLRGVQAELFRYLDRYRSLTAIRAHFEAVQDSLLVGLLERWQHWGLVYASPPDASGESRHLALIPRRGPATRVAPRPVPGKAVRLPALKRIGLEVIQ